MQNMLNSPNFERNRSGCEIIGLRPKSLKFGPKEKEWQEFALRNKLPEKYRNALIDTLIIPEGNKSYKIIANEFFSRPESVMLVGNAGRGKTHFMFALLHALIAHGKIHPSEIRFFRSIDLDDRLKSEHKQHGSSKYFIDDISELPFLCIDDFGIARDSATAERDYFNLIDQRFAHGRITILSTNLPPEQLKLSCGERIFSRLKDARLIEFNGPDLRGQNI